MGTASGRAGVWQRDLFACEPDCDRLFRRLERTDLGSGAWVDWCRGWLDGHDAILEALWSGTRWRVQRRVMYDRVVDVPRLVATLPEDGAGHPLLPEAAVALGARYGRPVDEISLAAYRDGRDSVAFHGDRLGRVMDDAVVAIVSLGAPRRFLMRPAGGGSSLAFDLAGGDLLVMGGTCQRTWQHAVPKTARAGLRVSVQFRPVALPSDD